MDLGSDQVHRAERGTETRVFLIGSDHGDLAEVHHGPSEFVQAHRVDAIVVGDQDAHCDDGIGRSRHR